MTQPINIYFTHIDYCIQYATDGKIPFTAEQILTTTTFSMQQTGLLQEVLRIWKAKTAVTITWDSFKKFFADEYTELKEEGQLTAGQSGFHQANIMENVSHALDNIANAAVGDRNITSVLVQNNAKLTNTNTKLTEANRLLTEQVKKLQDNYLQLNDMIKDIKTNNA
eukprot:182518-Ditylum_brightwellii.AAC.1